MPIMQQSAPSLHARTSFVFGSPDNVSRIADYFTLSEREVSALFNSRGLFRA
jgi:fructose-1,6-bisphosphatase I